MAPSAESTAGKLARSVATLSSSRAYLRIEPRARGACTVRPGASASQQIGAALAR